MAKRKPFTWLAELPTTQLRICVTLLVVAATAVRYLFLANPPAEMGAWLTFVAGLASIDTATVVGKRWTSDPDVIAAEAAAQQPATPAVVAAPAGEWTPAVPGDGQSVRS